MKIKKPNKNLFLKKETVVNLNRTSLESAKGGFQGETVNPVVTIEGGLWYCVSRACHTFCLGNCETWEVQICQTGNSADMICYQ
ncbi:MAG: hypothetical protein GY765_32900 [bacterium]|nr:hypothetical protein [bacterium]